MRNKEKAIVHAETIALIPYFDEYGNSCTEIIETTGTYRVDASPCQVVKDSCEFYGSTYDGARKAAQLILKSRQMLPITVSAPIGVYFIPTMSPDNENNKWVALDHIEDVQPHGQKGCKFTLTGGHNLILEGNCQMFRAKVQRATQLKYIVDKRNKRD